MLHIVFMDKFSLAKYISLASIAHCGSVDFNIDQQDMIFYWKKKL